MSSEWLASLFVLGPFRTDLRVLAVLLLGAGFWIVYGHTVPYKGGEACVTSPSRRATKSALWFGTLLMVLVLTCGCWQCFIA